MEKNIKKAQSVYQTLISYLIKHKVRFREDDDLRVSFMIKGDHMQIYIALYIDAYRQLISLSSPILFKVYEDKSLEFAVATCHINENLLDGFFAFNITEGSIAFQMTSCFIDSLISEDVFDYLISTAFNIVNEYNHAYLSLNKGEITLYDFINNVD